MERNLVSKMELSKMAELFTRSGRIFRWSPQDGELVLGEGRVSNFVQATSSPP